MRVGKEFNMVAKTREEILLKENKRLRKAIISFGPKINKMDETLNRLRKKLTDLQILIIKLPDV
jgi:hypothetical protein